jgi:cytochrome c peroxidase
LGKFELTKEIHRNSFKTPTIRNIELTAPYMHNGVFKTLEEVIDFYMTAVVWDLICKTKRYPKTN